MARSRSGPLRGNSNRYAHPYNRHCIRREPVALSAGRGCDSNFTFSLTVTLYCRLHIGFERCTLPGPRTAWSIRWLIAGQLCAHLRRRNEPSPQVRHRPAKALGSSGPPKTAVERRRRQVSPHTPRRVRVGVRAHQVLRIHLGRGPRAPEQACAHPLVHFCDAGHFWSVFGHRRDPWQHSRPHRASSAWPRAVMSGAAATSVVRIALL